MGNQVARAGDRLAPDLTRVHGIYPKCDWDEHRVRRLITDRRLAPCHVGKESGGVVGEDLEECPICMYFYPLMNRTKCCNSAICTECYLQLAPERRIGSSHCPFCKNELAVAFLGPRSEAELGAERARREELIAVQIRMMQDYLSETSTPTSSQMRGGAAAPAAEPRAGDGRVQHTPPPSMGGHSTLSTLTSRMLSPLPSPDLLASSPRASALLASVELLSALPLAYSSAQRAPPIALDIDLSSAAASSTYLERWERAQVEQREASRDSSLANAALPPPPDYAPAPRTLEGIIGSSALAGRAAGWSHDEAEAVEELMLLEAIRLSLESAGEGVQAGAGASAPDVSTARVETPDADAGVASGAASGAASADAPLAKGDEASGDAPSADAIGAPTGSAMPRSVTAT
jgi:hypothetical protein